MMRHFHVTIHAHPGTKIPVVKSTLDGQPTNALNVTPLQLSSPFPVTFDLAAERLQRIDRVFFEPDGSFVWVSPDGGKEWKLDGQLFDGGAFLMTIELKGFARWRILAQLLETLDWPEHDVVFQDMPHGIFLSTDSFRELAER